MRRLLPRGSGRSPVAQAAHFGLVGSLGVVARRRSLVGKHIDWLIHVMYTEIFPYYALKTARNARQADQQRAAAVYVHDILLPAAVAGGRAL